MTTRNELAKQEISEGKIKSYADRITKVWNNSVIPAWNKAVEGIFAVGDLILKARKDLGADSREYRTLLNSLPFGAESAERIARIAADPRLRGKRVQKLLPPHWGTLDEIRKLNDNQFKKAQKNGIITPHITREEVTEFRVNNGTVRSKSGTAHFTEPKENKSKANNSITLIFEVPDDFKNRKTLLDVYFICYLAELFFSNAPSKPRVEVSRDGLKPSKKLHNSFNRLLELIENTRAADNYRREQKRKSKLNKVQEVLSLLGADPDALGKSGFSLMERLALSYAKRQGINCISEKQFQWTAKTDDLEPELLGSFLRDVEETVALILAGKSPKAPPTQIFELDSDTTKRIARETVPTSRNGESRRQ